MSPFRKFSEIEVIALLLGGFYAWNILIFLLMALYICLWNVYSFFFFSVKANRIVITVTELFLVRKVMDMVDRSLTRSTMVWLEKRTDFKI